MDSKLRNLICPVCGRAMLRHYYQDRQKQKIVCDTGSRKVKKYKSYKDPDSIIAYFDYISKIYDLNRDYIAVESEGGRAGLQYTQHITKEQWERGFTLIKYAVVRALVWWINKGWTSCDEICEMVDNFSNIPVPIDIPEYLDNFSKVRGTTDMTTIILKPNDKYRVKYKKTIARTLARIDKMKAERDKVQKQLFKLRSEMVDIESFITVLNTKKQKLEKDFNADITKRQQNRIPSKGKRIMTEVQSEDEYSGEPMGFDEYNDMSVSNILLSMFPGQLDKMIHEGKTTKEDYETIMSNLLPIEIKALQNTKENIEKGGVKFLMTLRKQGIYSNDVIDTLMRSANNADKLRKLLLKKFKPSE